MTGNQQIRRLITSAFGCCDMRTGHTARSALPANAAGSQHAVYQHAKGGASKRSVGCVTDEPAGWRLVRSIRLAPPVPPLDGRGIGTNSMKNLALIHSTACRTLLDDGQLDDALRYCLAQGIAPPFSPCDKTAPEYERCVALAKETLSDYGWWEKRLKLRAARQLQAPG